jgi:hypothetical protein
MINKLSDWLDRRAVTQQRTDYLKGFSWAAGQILLYGTVTGHHCYGKDDDFDKGVFDAIHKLKTAAISAEKAEAALREADAYKTILEQLQSDLAVSVEASAAVTAERGVYPTVEQIIAYNELPDWPEIWVAQDEDGSVWVYKTEPTKYYLKADHSGGFEPTPLSAKRLNPPLTLYSNWQQTKRRVK